MTTESRGAFAFPGWLVFSPSSLPPVPEGVVMLTFDGHEKRKQGRQVIGQHPVADAAPAFWRMVEAEFGIIR